jgi:zinc protease
MSARRLAALAASLGLAAAPLLAQADRSQPPKPGPVRELKLPPTERHTLANGLNVLLVGMHEVPVVELVLVLPAAGATADPAGREGLAAMTADMLDEGAAGRDALALADAIDFLGASLATTSTWDAASVRLRVPVARLADALPLMADVALRPDFEPSELARLKKEALTDLLQARDEPGAIANRALAQAVFGSTHRYGKPQAGSAEQIASFTPAELTAFHASRYRPAGAFLVVVGDVSASVLPALEQAFGGWTAGPAPAAVPAVPAPRQLSRRTIWLVDKKDAAQSALRLGRVGPGWPDPSYARTDVMNTLLGGSFTSRLNDNLREQHGYSYGAASGFLRYRTGGLFLVRTDVQTDKTAPAVGEVFKELDRILAPASAAEVERARNYAALGYAGDFETTSQLAQRMVQKLLYALPDGFFESYVPQALATDAVTLQQAARATIDPRRIALVVVGDRSRVEAPLAALKLGPVRTLSVDEVMGPPPRLD